MIKILSNIFLKEAQSIKMIKTPKAKKWLINVLYFIGIVVYYTLMSLPTLLQVDEIKKLIPLNIGYLILIVGFMFSATVSMLSSITLVYSSGYLDKNLENYIHLPINQKDFVTAKVLAIYMNVLKLTLLLILQPIILSIFFEGFDIVMIVSAVFYTITTPIITTYIAIVLVGTVLYFLNKLKNKSLAQNILYSLFIIFFMAYVAVSSLVFSKIYRTAGDPTYLASLFNTIITNVKLVFFYFNWSIEVFTDHKYINILWMILTLIVGYVSVLYFQRIYYKGAVGFSSNTSSTKSTKYKKPQIKSRGIIKWFLYREWKQLTKNKVFFLNTLLGSIIFVLTYSASMLMPYIIGGDKTSPLIPIIKEFKKDISVFLPIVFLVTVGMSTFTSMLNTGTATIYSREKNDLEILKTLPINMKKAFLGKVLLHYLIGFFTTFIFLLLPMLFSKVEFIYILTMAISILFTNSALIWIPVIADLRSPNLDWESETMVIKRSKSIGISMLSNLALSTIINGSMYLMIFVAKIDTKIVACSMFVFLLILATVLYKVYQKLMDKIFR